MEMEFWEKLQRLIEQQSITRKEVARRSGVKLGTVSNIIGSTREPSSTVALAICRALKVDPDWMLDPSKDWPPVPAGGVSSALDMVSPSYRDIARVVFADRFGWPATVAIAVELLGTILRQTMGVGNAYDAEVATGLAAVAVLGRKRGETWADASRELSRSIHDIDAVALHGLVSKAREAMDCADSRKDDDARDDFELIARHVLAWADELATAPDKVERIEAMRSGTYAERRSPTPEERREIYRKTFERMDAAESEAHEQPRAAG